MKRFTFLLFLLLTLGAAAHAQITLDDNNVFAPLGDDMNSGRRSDADLQGDTVKKTDIPVGYYVWHISPRFGDVVPATPDTLPHWFQNANLTDGYNGTYNFLGNIGHPDGRQLRHPGLGGRGGQGDLPEHPQIHPLSALLQHRRGGHHVPCHA